MRDEVITGKTYEMLLSCGFNKDTDLDWTEYTNERKGKLNSVYSVKVSHPITQSLVQRWLRSKEIWVFAYPRHHPYMDKVEFGHPSSAINFATYEDALEDAIKWGLLTLQARLASILNPNAPNPQHPNNDDKNNENGDNISQWSV